MCNMCRKFGKNWTCSFWDMLADRQTDTLIAILCLPAGGEVIRCYLFWFCGMQYGCRSYSVWCPVVCHVTVLLSSVESSKLAWKLFMSRLTRGPVYSSEGQRSRRQRAWSSVCVLDDRTEDDFEVHLGKATSWSAVSDHGPERCRKVVLTQHSYRIYVRQQHTCIVLATQSRDIFKVALIVETIARTTVQGEMTAKSMGICYNQTVS